MINELTLITIVLLILDVSFLTTIGPLFRRQVVRVQKTPFIMDYSGALFAYLLLVISLYWFVVRERRPLKDAFLLGFIIYGVYEGTTKALLTNWEYKTMAIDTMWGGTVMTLTAFIVYKLLNINTV